MRAALIWRFDSARSLRVADRNKSIVMCAYIYRTCDSCNFYFQFFSRIFFVRTFFFVSGSIENKLFKVQKFMHREKPKLSMRERRQQHLSGVCIRENKKTATTNSNWLNKFMSSNIELQQPQSYITKIQQQKNEITTISYVRTVYNLYFVSTNFYIVLRVF